ncbi:hypothetical protein [Calothrix sp. 336/3]|uniref:hypothetical protein n=1 Tax=Calothrix sp. 336/3 TaxID=1337936 RepID=UPI0004E2BF46|nr:hypothetical protein [Calothrix sp. 336/3]AKG22462.1 hypothetical protein IJ00_15370 [Calothrix sp. 336/3]
MNTIILSKKLSYCLGLAAVAVLSADLTAVAQTTETPLGDENPSQVNVVSVENASKNTQIPVPGTVTTSSANLRQENSVKEFPSVTNPNQVAQAEINPGRSTRGGSSYLGVAGNIGLGGDSALGDGNFMVLSKIGLTRSISVRPSVVFGDDTVFLLPVSYDFNFQSVNDPFSEPLPIAPYIGAGAALKTGDDSQVAFLVSGGIDVPLNSQFTATAAVNAAFFDKTDVGLAIGIGYNFSGF